MHEAVARMLSRYGCKNAEDHAHALHEIMQEIALLGLWRGKFFEKAAFYGGTALRILDVDQARREVEPFVKHPEVLAIWSREFFQDVGKRIRVV